jgi:hypothetical protein
MLLGVCFDIGIIGLPTKILDSKVAAGGLVPRLLVVNVGVEIGRSMASIDRPFDWHPLAAQIDGKTI